MRLHAKILSGLVAGIAIGGLAKLPGLEGGGVQRVVLAVEPVGTAFIRLVSMVVVPLVIGSLFVGVTSLGDVRRLGRIGGKTLLYFAGSTLAAAGIGLIVAKLLNVGGGLDVAARDALTAPFLGQASPASGPPPTLVQTLLAMIPSNPFTAAAQGDRKSVV